MFLCILYLVATNLVDAVEQNLNNTDGKLNIQIEQAQDAINILPNTSSVKVLLQNRLNNLKGKIKTIFNLLLL
jgi:hypothetical protein